MSAAALHVRSATVRYSRVAAVRDLELSVGETQTVALIGPNGAGKTTLLNAISRLIPLASGEIEILGLPHRVQPHDLRAIGVARTFQHARLVEEFTVLDNVLVGGFAGRGLRSLASESVYGRRGRRDARRHAERAAELLSTLGLADLRDRVTASLPFGRKKLVDLARSLMHEPRLLLMDEPTAGLTEAEVEPLAAMLRRLGDSISILVVAHHMEFVAAVADHVVCLDSGAKIAEGDVETVRRDPAVLNAYLGWTDG